MTRTLTPLEDLENPRQAIVPPLPILCSGSELGAASHTTHKIALGPEACANGLRISLDQFPLEGLMAYHSTGKVS